MFDDNLIEKLQLAELNTLLFYALIFGDINKNIFYLSKTPINNKYLSR